MSTLWDCNAADIVTALSAERRSAGAVARGLVLNLVVVVDEREATRAIAAAEAAALAHPCRQLAVIRSRPDAPESRLDAEVGVGGRHGPGESVVLRMSGRLARHGESVVLPLLAPDIPVVTFWHGEPPQRTAHDSLGALAERRITDSAAAEDALEALAIRQREYTPGDTDLAWTRLSGWRSVLASAMDSHNDTVVSARVTGEPGNPSAHLLAAWLANRLGVEVTVANSRGPGITEVVLRFGGAGSADGEDAGQLTLRRLDGRHARLSRPGQDDRVLPLARRDLDDLLAEELRRLGPDELYAETLAAFVQRASGGTGPVPAGAR